MNFEKIGKMMDSKAKELAEHDSNTGEKTDGKEMQWMMGFSIVAILAAFLPFAKFTSFFTGTISMSLFDMVCQEQWNLLLWAPQIIVLIMIVKKVRCSNIVIPTVTGFGFWLNVFWAMSIYEDVVNDEYGMTSLGIGFWLTIVSLFGINWMADKLGMGIISLIKRLLIKVIPFDAQNTETQPINVNVHPVTNEGIICNECGITLSNDAKFCPGCGTAVLIKEKGKCCSNCGSEYREGAAFCGRCGEKTN